MSAPSLKPILIEELRARAGRETGELRECLVRVVAFVERVNQIASSTDDEQVIARTRDLFAALGLVLAAPPADRAKAFDLLELAISETPELHS